MDMAFPSPPKSLKFLTSRQAPFAIAFIPHGLNGFSKTSLIHLLFYLLPSLSGYHYSPWQERDLVVIQNVPSDFSFHSSHCHDHCHAPIDSNPCSTIKTIFLLQDIHCYLQMAQGSISLKFSSSFCSFGANSSFMNGVLDHNSAM